MFETDYNVGLESTLVECKFILCLLFCFAHERNKHFHYRKIFQQIHCFSEYSIPL